MTAQEQQDTKDKILEVATDLFAQFGFDGTSIRELARQADANVAAINYHFKNKQSLYWAVMERSHLKLENGIIAISENAKNTEDLAVGTFDFLLNEKRSLRNALKMMLSESVAEPDADMQEFSCITKPGPPGFEYFIPFIQKDVGEPLNEGAVMFAVKAIFSSIIQWGMMCSTPKLEVLRQIDETFSEDYFRLHIRHQVRSTLEYIKTHKKELDFKNLKKPT